LAIDVLRMHHFVPLVSPVEVLPELLPMPLDMLPPISAIVAA
jgi:hypothetical protein